MLERLLNEMNFLRELIETADAGSDTAYMIINRINKVRALIEFEIENIKGGYL